jgi:hypothetical protein
MVDLCTLTGIMKRPDGTPFANGELVLVPDPVAVVAVGTAVSVPTRTVVTTGADGTTTITLRPGTYNGQGIAPGERFGFLLGVPDVASADLEDWLGLDVEVLTSAEQARDAAQAAQAEAEQALEDATAQAVISTEAALESQAARDAALLADGVFTTVEEGRVATPVGKVFIVPRLGYMDLYSVQAGPVAVFLDSLPTSALIQSIADALGYSSSGDLFIWRDALSRIVGRVNTAAEWDILLKSVRTASFRIYDYEVAGISAPLVIVDANKKILWQAPEPGEAQTNAEVIAARGTAVDLSARLARSMSPAGTTLSSVFGQERMRNLRRKLTARRRGLAVQVNIAFMGDSFTHLWTRYSGRVAEMLIALFGDGGGGWTGYGHRHQPDEEDPTPVNGPWVIGEVQPGGKNGNARPGLYQYNLRGTWVPVRNASNSPDLDHITTTEVGAMVQRTVPASPNHTAIRVLFEGTADGVVRHRVDGGSWTTQNVQGTVGLMQTFDVPLDPGAHTIEIEVVSGTVTLAGDNSLSAASGVRVHKLGASGSRLAQWVARDAANQQIGWAMLALDTVTIMDGTNSQGNGVPPADWYDQIIELAGRLRAACPAIDRGIVMPPENNRIGNAVPMPLYAAQGREAAVALGAAFMDLQSAFGDDPDEYRFDGPNPLMANDLIHPQPETGGDLMQGEFMFFLVHF